MKKGIIKFLIKRLKNKTPKLFNAIALIAIALIAMFFGVDNVYDLCELSEVLCKNQEFIYTILTLIVAASRFAEDKPKKKRR